MAVSRVGFVACILALLQGFASAQEGGVEKAFQLSLIPGEVNRFSSQNMAVRCDHNPNGSCGLEQIFRMRILKQSESGWSLLAEMRDVNNSPTRTGDFQVSADISNRKVAYLQVAWSNVQEENFGVYRCEVIGFDAQRSTVIELADDLIAQESDVSSEYLLTLSQATQEKVTEVKVATDSELNVLKQKVSSLETFIGRLNQWPSGNYALPRPNTGCPLDLNFFGGTHKYHKLHTESRGSREPMDATSQAFNAMTSYKTGIKKFFTIELCEATQQTLNNNRFPQGNYCIHGFVGIECPEGFNRGEVQLTTETFKPSGSGINRIADGPINSTLSFCCRNDGSSRQEMVLPTSSPFMLYRVGGECQKVAGMEATNEFTFLNTQDKDNNDQIRGRVPDIDLPAQPDTSTIRFNMCYYQ